MEFNYVNMVIYYLLDWLETLYPKGQRINVNVMNGFQAVEGMTGQGFGAYVNGGGVSGPTILIAGEVPPEIVEADEKAEFFCKVFLHEFKHHLQYMESHESVFAESAEDDANAFAETEFPKFKAWLGEENFNWII